MPPPSQRHLYRFARDFSEKIKSGNVQETPRDAEATPKDGTGDSVRKPGESGDGKAGTRPEKAAATNSRTAKGTVRVDTAKPTDKEKLDVDLPGRAASPDTATRAVEKNVANISGDLT